MISFFRRHPWRIVLAVTWGAWFFSLWPRWFWVNEEGIWAGQPFIWADWSVHLTYVSRFLFTPLTLWFSHHPVFALERWTYPPLPNLLSAALLAIGLPLGAAMLLPVIVATALLLLFLFFWFRAQRLSERASWLGTTLFLLSGAWGWPIWLKSVLGSTQPWSEIQFPSRLYTQVFENHLVWLNPIAGMVLPQRAFTIGFPILLAILIALRRQVMGAKLFTWKLVLLLAVASVVLLLTHTHSFLALGILCVVWAFLFPKLWRFWLVYGGLTLALALAWYWFVLRGSGAVTSFSVDWGWMSPEPFSLWGWVWFWLKNWGFFLPLAMLGWWKADHKNRSWWSGFFCLFLFANVVRTQSYDWDNAKLLIVALAGLLPVVVSALQFLRKKLPPLLGSAVVVSVVLLSVWGGVLEAVRISQPQRTTWRMAGLEEIQFAQMVRQTVPASEIVLTSDLHNHPVPMLAGRPVLLGYVGWVWSYGFKYDQVQVDVKTMYIDPDRSAELRRRYEIRYAVVGPHEKTVFGDSLLLENQCEKRGEVGVYALLDCGL